MKRFKLFFCILLSLTIFNSLKSAEQIDPIKVDWSFKGLLGKFDRASLQRGYQVYNEVCASCHSMQYLSYRNLSEPGGPEFSEEEVKAIAAGFEVTDGPDAQGEMFTRPGRPSDKFVSPYPNVNAAAATVTQPDSNGDIIRIIGYALTTGDTNKIWFNPDSTFVEYTT